MRILLDTHTLIWFYLGEAQLSDLALSAILEPNNVKLVSPASYWEVAIKVSIGKYRLNVPYEQFIQESISDNGFQVLPIAPKHTAALIALPRHHGDPFDRLLLAQANVEGIPLVSADDTFDEYAVNRL